MEQFHGTSPWNRFMDAYDADKRFSGLCVSVPPEYSQLGQYRATLGHKANHGDGG